MTSVKKIKTTDSGFYIYINVKNYFIDFGGYLIILYLTYLNFQNVISRVSFDR